MPFNFDVNAWIYIDGGHVLGGFGAYIVKGMAVQLVIYVCRIGHCFISSKGKKERIRERKEKKKEKKKKRKKEVIKVWE